MSVEEKLNQAKGSIKEGVGTAIGDEKMEKVWGLYVCNGDVSEFCCLRKF